MVRASGPIRLNARVAERSVAIALNVFIAGSVPSSFDCGFSRTTTTTIRGSIAGTKPANDEMYASST